MNLPTAHHEEIEDLFIGKTVKLRELGLIGVVDRMDFDELGQAVMVVICDGEEYFVYDGRQWKILDEDWILESEVIG